jgi:hypothetical protein
VSEPRPNEQNCLRTASSLRIQFSSDEGSRDWASTLTPW